MENKGHPDTTGPLEAADGTAAEFERGSLVADEKRDRGGPEESMALWWPSSVLS